MDEKFNSLFFNPAYLEYISGKWDKKKTEDVTTSKELEKVIEEPKELEKKSEEPKKKSWNRWNHKKEPKKEQTKEETKEESKPEKSKESKEEPKVFGVSLLPNFEMMTRIANTLIIDKLINADEEIKNELARMEGFNINQPIEIIQVSDAKVSVKRGNGMASTTSKADVVIINGNNKYGIKFITGIVGKAIFSQWKFEDVFKGLASAPEVELTQTYLTSPEALTLNNLEDLNRFYTQGEGKQFIISCVKNLDAQGNLFGTPYEASYILLCHAEGIEMKVETLLKTEEYIEVLQELGAGTFGSGIVMTTNEKGEFVLRQC